MRDLSVDKVAFVLSLAFLAWFYGFATSTRGWFPNDYIVRAWQQGRAVLADDPPPEWTRLAVHDREGVRTTDPDRAERPALTLVASHWENFGWKPGLKLIDRDGRVVHEWRVDPPAIFDDSMDRRPREDVVLERRQIHGFHLFPNGDVLVNVENVGTVRLDACGRVVWRLPVGSHHSLERAADGSFWAPVSASRNRTDSLARSGDFLGMRSSWLLDGIVRFSEDGELLDEVSLLRVLYDNGLERHILKSTDWDERDVTHLNDVEPLAPGMAGDYPLFEAGDLLVSLRSLDLVMVFDPESRRVRWHASHPFIQQHDPDFIGDGWIGVFDNNTDGTERGSVLGGSRIVAVQPHTDSTRVLFPTSRSEPFYTDIMGEWQRLANGNLLLTESIPGRVLEVASDGSTVWEWIRERYGDARMPWLTGSRRYSLDPGAVASWGCSSDGPSDVETTTELEPKP